jgi:alpha-tubulin suppressor-like RCC1 family protein
VAVCVAAWLPAVAIAVSPDAPGTLVVPANAWWRPTEIDHVSAANGRIAYVVTQFDLPAETLYVVEDGVTSPLAELYDRWRSQGGFISFGLTLVGNVIAVPHEMLTGDVFPGAIDLYDLDADTMEVVSFADDERFVGLGSDGSIYYDRATEVWGGTGFIRDLYRRRVGLPDQLLASAGLGVTGLQADSTGVLWTRNRPFQEGYGTAVAYFDFATNSEEVLATDEIFGQLALQPSLISWGTPATISWRARSGGAINTANVARGFSDGVHLAYVTQRSVQPYTTYRLTISDLDGGTQVVPDLTVLGGSPVMGFGGHVLVEAMHNVFDVGIWDVAPDGTATLASPVVPEVAEAGAATIVGGRLVYADTSVLQVSVYEKRLSSVDSQLTISSDRLVTSGLFGDFTTFSPVQLEVSGPRIAIAHEVVPGHSRRLVVQYDGLTTHQFDGDDVQLIDLSGDWLLYRDAANTAQLLNLVTDDAFPVTSFRFDLSGDYLYRASGGFNDGLIVREHLPTGTTEVMRPFDTCEVTAIDAAGADVTWRCKHDDGSIERMVRFSDGTLLDVSAVVPATSIDDVQLGDGWLAWQRGDIGPDGPQVLAIDAVDLDDPTLEVATLGNAPSRYEWDLDETGDLVTWVGLDRRIRVNDLDPSTPVASAPVVDGVAPAAGPASGGTVVTVTGEALRGATEVAFGGVPGTDLVEVSDTELRVTTPTHDPGVRNVRVTTPAGRSWFSRAAKFTFLPTVTGVVPSAGPVAGGTEVTLTGIGFAGATEVAFGGVPGTDLVRVSDTELRVTTPAREAGVRNVRVTTPIGLSRFSPLAKYTFVDPPVVTAVTPAFGSIEGGDVVTVMGTALAGASAVLFGGVPGTDLVQVSPTELRVATPSRAAGVRNVRVQTSGGLSSFSPLAKFRFGAIFDLFAWGDNVYGQLGDGTITERVTPTDVADGRDWAAVSGGWLHTMAIRGDGTLWGWGRNASGQLGIPTVTDEQLDPLQVGSDSNWRSVGAGGSHTLAIKDDGTLWGWGDNSVGEIGDGTTTSRLAPTRVGSDSDWSSVSAGGSHTLAIKDDGTLWGWGDNRYGQVGDGSHTNRTTPVRIGARSDWVHVEAGRLYSTALRGDGTLWTWGDNVTGELGDGTTTGRSAPIRVGTDTDWVYSNGGGHHTVALKSDGTLWGWGRNGAGQLGDGTTEGAGHLSPLQIGEDDDWVDVSLGYEHTVALKSDGTLWVWGYNQYGQVGDGTNTDRTIPVRIGVDADWARIGAGWYYTLAMRR